MLEQIPEVKELIERIVFTEKEINGICDEQTKRALNYILSNNQDKMTMIIVKNGAIPYANMLKLKIIEALKIINYQLTTVDDDIIIKSYKGTQGGKIKVLEDIKTDIANKIVLVVEDIYDSGKTIDFLHQHILSKKPRNICFSIFMKRKFGYITDYLIDVGAYTQSKGWFVGFGLDYFEHYRELPYLAEIKDIYRKK